MQDNPFLDTIKAFDEEIAIRKARENLIDYEVYTNPGYKATRLHTFLCNEVQKFLETETGNAIDVLLLSIP